MSDDLIKRLQGVVWCTFDTLDADHTLAVEAAAALSEAQANIARLEAALRSIAANTCCEGCQEAARVARAALSPKTPTTAAPE